MNNIKQKFKLIYIIFSIILFILILYIFHEDIIAEYKEIFNIHPEQYYGVTVDMSQILPESENYVRNSKGEDLIDITAKMGINTLRITNINSISKNIETQSFTYEQWGEVLNKMRRKGIYAVILIEANNINPYFHQTELTENYVYFVKNYIESSNVCNYHNIIAIDIRNEPLLDENNLGKLKQASDIVRDACPTAKITIGSWRTENDKINKSGEAEYNWHDPKDAVKIKDIVDIYSVHIYGFDKPVNGHYPDSYQLTSGYINEIKKYIGNKPLLIEEFGAGNGSALTDQNTLGSPQLQKEAYDGVLMTTHDYKYKNVIGALAYLFISRSNKMDGWSLAGNMGDTIMPAAYSFKKFTTN